MTIEDSDTALQVVEAGRVRVQARLREAIEDQLRARAGLIGVDPGTVDALVLEAEGRAGASLWRISLAEGAADLWGVAVRDALADPVVAAAEQLVGAADETLEALPVEEPWRDWADEPEVTAIGEPAPVPPVPPAPASAPAPATDPATAALPAPVAEPVPAPIAEPAPVPPAPAPPPAPEPAPAPERELRIAVTHAGGIESLKAGDKDIELRLSDAGLDVLQRSSGAALGRLDWSQITGIDVAQPKRGRRRKKKPHALQVHTAGGDATFELPELDAEQIDARVTPMLTYLRETARLS